MLSKIPMLLLCGDSFVGKTSFRTYLCNNYFSEQYIPTLGIDFSFIKTSYRALDNTSNLKYQMWDFSGNNSFQELLPEFMVTIDYFIIMYDCSNRSSFYNVRAWLKLLTKYVDLATREIFIIANKLDLRTFNPNCVLTHEAVSFLHDLKKEFFNNKQSIHFFEISVKTGENLAEILTYLAGLTIN